MTSLAVSETSVKSSNWLIITLLLSVTFLHKFGITVGESQIFFSFLIMLLLSAIGYLSGHFEIRKDNFLAYVLMVGTLIATQLLGAQEFSVPSLFLLIIVHIPYILGLKPGSVTPRGPLLFYQKIMVFFSVLGVIQYFAQYVIGPKYAFPIDFFMQPFVMKGFNSLNQLGYGVEFYKSTAVFMLEPAMLCQYLAVAVIIEMVYFKNIKRFISYFAGIAVTFSGTGLLLLMVLAPVYLVIKRRFLILMTAAICVVTAPVWAPLVGLERTVERASEFTSEKSSGYARFLSIFRTLETKVLDDDQAMLFGRGAGSIVRVLATSGRDFEAFNPSWGKMVFEYGIIGGMAYFLFLGYVLWRGGSSSFVKVALVLQLMFLGEYVLAPMVHLLILSFVIWPPRKDMKVEEVQKAPESENAQASDSVSTKVTA